MEIRFLQWNIGGAYIRKPGTDGKDFATYTEPGLDYIAEIIRRYDVDIVTLQESHKDTKLDQLENLAFSTGLQYFVHDSYDVSHIDSSQQLGQGILSRFPITAHRFDLMTNPHIRFEMGGKTWVTHDKGVTKVELALTANTPCTVMTSHMIPFRKLEIDPLSQAARAVRDDFNRLSASTVKYQLMASDYNIDGDLMHQFAPGIFEAGSREVSLEVATTPRGRKYDHIIYRGLQLERNMVLVDALTDHFPVYAEFAVA